jgi:hypothetical protein
MNLLSPHFLYYRYGLDEDFVRFTYDEAMERFESIEGNFSPLKDLNIRTIGMLYNKLFQVSNVFRGLMAVFRGDHVYSGPSFYSGYTYNVPIDNTIFEPVELDAVRAETKLWIVRYADLLTRVKAYFKRIDHDGFPDWMYCMFPFGPVYHYHFSYFHRSIDDFQSLVESHSKYMSQNNFSLVRRGVTGVWMDRSAEINSPIDLSEVPPIDMACMLASNALRRASEYTPYSPIEEPVAVVEY